MSHRARPSPGIRTRDWNRGKDTLGRKYDSGTLYDAYSEPDSVTASQLRAPRKPPLAAKAPPPPVPCGVAYPLSVISQCSARNVALAAVIETLLCAAEADIAAAVSAHDINVLRATVSASTPRVAGIGGPPVAAALRRPLLTDLPSLAALVENLGVCGRTMETRHDPGAPPVRSFAMGSTAGAAWCTAIVAAARVLQQRMSRPSMDPEGRALLASPALLPLLSPTQLQASLAGTTTRDGNRQDRTVVPPSCLDSLERLQAVAAVEVAPVRDNSAVSAPLWACPPSVPQLHGVSVASPERDFVAPLVAADAASPPRIVSVETCAELDEVLHPLASVALRWGCDESQACPEGSAGSAAALEAFSDTCDGEAMTRTICSRLLQSISTADARARKGPKRALRVLDATAGDALGRVVLGRFDAAAATTLAFGANAAVDCALAVSGACTDAERALRSRARGLEGSLSALVKVHRTVSAAPCLAAPSAVALWELLRAAGAVTGLTWVGVFSAALASNGSAMVRALEPLLPEGFVDGVLLPGATRVMLLHAGAASAARGTALAQALVAQLRSVASACATAALPGALPSAATECSASATLLQHALEALSTHVHARRSEAALPVSVWKFAVHVPPQFAYAEFMLGSLLRPGQAELVASFAAAVRIGGDVAQLQQMLMVRGVAGVVAHPRRGPPQPPARPSSPQGQGKTSVIIPLLALMLADGRRTVSSVLPASLVSQSAATLRALLQVSCWSRCGQQQHSDRSGLPPRRTRLSTSPSSSFLLTAPRRATSPTRTATGS